MKPNKSIDETTGTSQQIKNVVSGFYQRIHGTAETDADKQQNIYYAAADNDNHGWDYAEKYIDPMFTLNRRNAEKDAASKDSFFKRLKVRLDKTTETKEKVIEAGRDTGTVDQTTPVVVGGMQFGFGMLSLAPLVPSTKESEEPSTPAPSEKTEKKKKDKKEKGKKEKGKKEKDKKHKDRESKESKKSKDKESKKKRKHKD